MSTVANPVEPLLRILCLSQDADICGPVEAALSAAGLGASVRFDATDPRSPDRELLEKANGVLCASFPEDLRAAAPALRWVQFWSAGVDGQLYPTLFRQADGRRGAAGGAEGAVAVATGSGIHAASASEHALSLMLAFARGLPQAFAAQQARDWSARPGVLNAIFELEGKTVGIVGAGQIGQAIGVRCQALGMRTIGTRRDASRPTSGIDVLFSHIQYHDLILESDIIVMALPLTSGTRAIFGEDEIEIVRKGTHLINIGRGGLIDEPHVVRALQNGWLAGAGLDVFVDEPLPPDSPFWTLPNCIVTPHVGGATPRYWTRFGALVVRQTLHLLRGEPLENRVDPDLGY